MSKPSLIELIACAQREVAMRKNVYPTRVTANRMPQEEADREIASMEAIVSTLQWLNRNADEIKDFVAIKKANPEGLAALRVFPGAEVSEKETA